MIPQGFIQQLIAQCDIEDILSSYITLKRAGRNIKASCPFHSEKTPSFVVYPETQSYYCFGCGAGGDVITFIKQAENLDYPEAVRFLAKKVGAVVPEDGDDEAAKIKASVYEINREAAHFFHKCLLSSHGEKGREYFFEKRQLSKEIIVTYGLGYAPDGWDNLHSYLKSKGFTDKQMLAAAVVAKGKSGHVYDQFRNRVIFPIIDIRGNVIGFGGRVLDDSKPKYLNSPDTPVFKKSRNLFSLNFAKTEVTDKLILAEGYMDVIAVYAAGFKNVVATLGTSLTEEQARLMSKYCKEVIIAYDSDGPGRAATMRAINLLSEANAQAKVLQMEGAKDPDEYIKKFGAKRFELLLNGAVDVILHELAEAKSKVDMETEEGKINYIKRAIYVLASIKNPIEREVYAAKVAHESGAMPDTIISQVGIVIKKQYAKREKDDWRAIEQNKDMTHDRINPQKVQNLKEAIAEEKIISFLFKNPDYYERVADKITQESFVTDYNRRIYEAMHTLNSQGCEITISLLAPMFTSAEISGISAIIAKNADNPSDEESLKDCINVLIEHKDKINPNTISQVDPEDIEKYRQNLIKKKLK